MTLLLNTTTGSVVLVRYESSTLKVPQNTKGKGRLKACLLNMHYCHSHDSRARTHGLDTRCGNIASQMRSMLTDKIQQLGKVEKR